MPCLKTYFLIPGIFLCIASAPAGVAAAPAEPAPWLVKVTTAESSPVPNAVIQLLGLRGEPLLDSAVTDAAGEAKLQPPAQGSYLIRVKKEGFKPKGLAFITSPKGSNAPPILIKLDRSA